MYCKDEKELGLAITEAEAQRALKSDYVVPVVEINPNVISKGPLVYFQIVLELQDGDFANLVEEGQLTVSVRLKVHSAGKNRLH